MSGVLFFGYLETWPRARNAGPRGHPQARAFAQFQQRTADVDSPPMLRRIWNYLSTNPLASAVLALYIFSVGGTVWASLAKVASPWFWADAGLSRGGVLIWALLTLAGIGIIYRLAASLRRVIRDLALRIGMDGKREPILTSNPVLQGRLPEPAEATRRVPGPTRSSTGMTGQPPIEPLELNKMEASVMKWCGHNWQPGVPAGITRAALELGMSALEVAGAVDGLRSKGLVQKIAPNAVILSDAGRTLCIERGWHGGLEASRRRDPRSAF